MHETVEVNMLRESDNSPMEQQNFSMTIKSYMCLYESTGFDICNINTAMDMIDVINEKKDTQYFIFSI